MDRIQIIAMTGMSSLDNNAYKKKEYQQQDVIKLYTSKECSADSEHFRKKLTEGGFPFEEMDITTRPDIYTDLLMRYGGQMTLPGIEFNGKTWIADTEDLCDELGRHWVDHLLSLPSPASTQAQGQQTHEAQGTKEQGDKLLFSFDDECTEPPLLSRVTTVATRNGSIGNGSVCTTSTTGTTKSKVVTEDILFLPHPTEQQDNDLAPLNRTVTDSVVVSDSVAVVSPSTPGDQEPWKNQTEKGEGASSPPPLFKESIQSETSATSATSGSVSLLFPATEDEGSDQNDKKNNIIILPNGNPITVGALTRLLVKATNHRCVMDNGTPYYYFRGYEAIDLWTILFFETDGSVNESTVKEFGEMLIERGIVHNYSPNCPNFAHTFLVLQPLQEPRVLNTFLKWPASCKTPASNIEDEDPMDVILSLSRLADEICNQKDYRDNLTLFHQLEEAVCQLQVIPFPTNPVEKVTFALNLYNLAVRHAMIVSEERNWTWPQHLDELAPIFSKLGYNINGDWISILDLHASLYGRSGEPSPTLSQTKKKQKWWKSVFANNCLGGRANVLGAHNDDCHYENPVIKTDPRILFTMTWGTHSSPIASTIYPNRLEEGLQTAAEIYCQKQVVVTADRVILPTLLSWHRADFGGTEHKVLHNILPYLSMSQLRGIQILRDSGRMSIVFADHGSFSWKCGPPPKEVDPRLLAHQHKRLQHASSIHAGLTTSQKRLNNIHTAAARPSQDRVSEPTRVRRNSNQSQKSRGLLRRWTGGSTSPSATKHSNTGPALYRENGRRSDGAGSGFGLFCHPMEPTETYHDEYPYDEYSNIQQQQEEDDDGHSFFQSVVSEVTYGSEFELLLGSERLCM